MKRSAWLKVGVLFSAALAAFAVGAVKLQSEGARAPWGAMPPPKLQDPYGQYPAQVRRVADARPQHNGQLIVKYRAAAAPAGVAATNSAALSLDLAHAQVASTARFATGGVSLAYARSITNRLHVVRTAGVGAPGRAATLADMQALAAQLAQDPQVEYAEVDRLRYPTATPNDALYASGQWHYHAPAGDNKGGANLPLAWDIGTGTGAVVAVVDTGITSHSDLNANVLPGYDFVGADNYSSYGLTDNYRAKDGGGWDNDASDPGDGITSSEATSICTALGTPTTTCVNDYKRNSSWHGTHVAGTIAAVSNNNQGVAGVAYGARIVPVRVLGRLGGATSDIAAGLRWAAGLAVSGVPTNANPARVINMSLGSAPPDPCSQTEQEAISAARAAGALVVVATGNDGVTSIGSPANCTGVLAVTAHTYEGDSAYYANVGTGTSISAPGGGWGAQTTGSGKPVYSTINLGQQDVGSEGYTGYQGTSMATPHVAGVAALLLGKFPSLTEAQVKNVITGQVRAFPSGSFCYGRNDCGSGLLDAQLALAAVQNAPSPTATASTSHSLVAKAVTQVVTLSVSASAPVTNGPLSYLWSQVGTSPSSVTLSNPTASVTTFTKPAGVRGTYSFQVVVTDGTYNKTTTKTVSVTSNTPPVLADVADMTTTVGQTLSFTLSGTDADGDTVTYGDAGTATPAPTVTANTGAVSWTPTQAGTYILSFKANDGLSDSGVKSTTVTVTSASGGDSGGGGGCTVGRPDQRDGSLLLLGSPWHWRCWSIRCWKRRCSAGACCTGLTGALRSTPGATTWR